MRAPQLVTVTLLALALSVGLALSGASVAHAENPVTFGSSHVSDEAGVLSSADTAAVEQAADSLYADDGIDLYVAFVGTFENPSSAEEWANIAASNNSLGPTDYLLAVAVDGRAYYLSGDSAGPVSGDQLSAIESTRIEPQLKNGNWAGAAEAAASGLAAATNGSGSSSSSGIPAGTIGAIVIVLVLILVIVGGIIVIVFVRASRRRRLAEGDGAPGGVASPRLGDGASGAGSSGATAPVDELQALSTEDLARRAGSALVQTDDAVQTSTQELGFALAQYGQDAVQPFRAALDSATAGLSTAFQLKQRLDDAEPDTEAETRQWNADIVHLCVEANRVLDEQAASFDELRQLEKNLPQAIVLGRAAVAEVEPRIAAGTTTLSTLGATWAESAFSTVADNPRQAAERLAFARTSLDEAEKDAAATPGDAAVGVRAAEEAVDQATLLLDALDRAVTDLAAARTRIDAMLTNLQQDVVDAHAVAAAGDPEGAITAVETRTSASVAEVQALLTAGRIDPAAVTQALELANRDIDGVLAAVRSLQAGQQRALTTLAQTLGSAGQRIRAATDYITARRGGVGADARTRLAEASRLLARALELQTVDPAGALSAAQRSDALAMQATELAQSDVGEFTAGAGYGGGDGGYGGAGGGLFGGGMFGSGSGGGSGGSGVLGAVLGGIIINSALGGGGGGGGLFGGGGGGLFGGGSRSRGGGGSFGGGSAGSFGGGGTRSRRGGGRF